MKTLNNTHDVHNFIQDNLSILSKTIREMETSEICISLENTEYAHLKQAIHRIYVGANSNELIRTFIVTAALDYCNQFGNYFSK